MRATSCHEDPGALSPLVSQDTGTTQKDRHIQTVELILALRAQATDRSAMASWMFGTFLANMKPAYESRVDTVFEGPKLKQVWVDIEHKCWETYLEEADDDFKGVHPYLKLKKEVSHCKAVIKEDTRREVLQDCTQRIVDLAKECSASRSGKGLTKSQSRE
eukprot:s202_g2.t1